MSGICDVRAGRAAAVAGRLAMVLAVVLLAAGELSGLLGSSSALLTMLPALALVAAMLIRPYLGERTIARLRARRRAREPLVRPAQPLSPRRRSARALARGGRLIAAALAGRAPPARAHASTMLAGCR